MALTCVLDRRQGRRLPDDDRTFLIVRRLGGNGTPP